MYFNLIVDSLQRAIPGLSAVYVFGSQATSGAGPESDLDFAILADGPLDAVRLWEVASALEGVAMCPVDFARLAGCIDGYAVSNYHFRQQALGA